MWPLHLSFNITFSRFIHFVALLCFYGQVIVCKDISHFFVHSSADEHLNCFQFLAVIRKKGFADRLGIVRIGCSGNKRDTKGLQNYAELENCGKLERIVAQLCPVLYLHSAALYVEM